MAAAVAAVAEFDDDDDFAMAAAVAEFDDDNDLLLMQIQTFLIYLGTKAFSHAHKRHTIGKRRSRRAEWRAFRDDVTCRTW